MFESNYCKVYIEEELDAVVCIWKAFCKQRNYREPLEYGLSILQQNGESNWIIDTSNGFENEEEDNKWLVEDFIPKVTYSSCKHIFFIISENSELRNEIIQQGTMLEKYFTVSYCDCMGKIYEEIKFDNK